MVLMIAIMSIMVVNIAYTGGYSSVMTKPIYQHSIDSLEDFLNSNLPWGSLQTADWIKAWKLKKEVIVFILWSSFSATL